MKSIDKLREYTNGDALRAGMSLRTARDGILAHIDAIEREVADMVPLPVDADGEVWHVGDFAVGEVNPKNPKAIERMIWYGPDSGWQLETDTIIYPCPDRPRHHHAPTVEDVLREFIDSWADTEGREDERRVMDEYAAKLRLAESE